MLQPASDRLSSIRAAACVAAASAGAGDAADTAAMRRTGAIQTRSRRSSSCGAGTQHRHPSRSLQQVRCRLKMCTSDAAPQYSELTHVHTDAIDASNVSSKLTGLITPNLMCRPVQGFGVGSAAAGDVSRVRGPSCTTSALSFCLRSETRLFVDAHSAKSRQSKAAPSCQLYAHSHVFVHCYREGPEGRNAKRTAELAHAPEVCNNETTLGKVSDMRSHYLFSHQNLQLPATTLCRVAAPQAAIPSSCPADATAFCTFGNVQTIFLTQLHTIRAGVECSSE